MAAGATTLGALASVAPGAVDELILVSRASGLGANGADGDSSGPSTSDDGRFIAFDSEADNLSGDDDNGYQNVFLRDTQTNTTTLISRQSGTAFDNGGDGDSRAPSISADGRYVAFESFAENLSGDDDNNLDVFVRDTVANTTTLISRQSGTAPMNGGDAGSSAPSISADGRYVAFSSNALNLSDDDNDTYDDVLIRDTQSNTTTLISRQSGTAPMNGGDGASRNPSISADGRFVAFESNANNLSGDDVDAQTDVFARDTQANTTTFVSRQTGTAPMNGGDDSSVDPSISADGRFVAFGSDADNLSPDANNFSNVFVRDLQSNTTSLVSRQSGTVPLNGGDDGSGEPSISAEGRFVAFQSEADNLSNDDNDNDVSDVFVRDTVTNTTTLISRQSGTAPLGGGDFDSRDNSISADGSFVAFESEADNLSGDDNDAYRDIFLRQFRELPSPLPTARCLGKAATKVGTAARDTLRGTTRRDVIAAMGGNDVVRGLRGNDLLCGGRGKDRLLGAAGRDTLLGQAGNDILRGGSARDVLKGGRGRDRLFGGGGRDRLAGGPGKDVQKQ